MLPTDLCIDIAACATDLGVVSRYVSRDDAHKTTRVHSIMADAIVTLLPEPGTGVLVLPALGALVALQGRRTGVGRRAAQDPRVAAGMA